jgi:hypothetical protein
MTVNPKWKPIPPDPDADLTDEEIAARPTWPEIIAILGFDPDDLEEMVAEDEAEDKPERDGTKA